MKANRSLALIPMLSLGILPLTGCLERKETIVVQPDGSVQMELCYEGTVQEMQTADALPSAQAGWKVSQSSKKEGDETKTTLLAQARFGPGATLPSSYAPAGGPTDEPYVSFPTEVWMELRPDGAYYHFRRVYQPRRWAYVQYWHQQIFTDDVKALGEKKKEELTHEERVTLVEAFAGMMAMEQIEFARTAMLRADPDSPQDSWLLTRRALENFYQNLDYDAIVKALEASAASPEPSAEDETAKQGAERVLDEARAVVTTSLQTQAGYDASQLEQFWTAYDWAEREYKITEQTGGHAFAIRLALPGELVAHNGEQVDDDGRVVWEFNGEAFRDRPCELMATSRVALHRTAN